MSGHSKWSKIKRQKFAGDQKKGMIFTKLGNAIILAAREGGGDSDANSMLRIAIDRAKEANMPKATIKRAIKKGLGELEGQKLEKASYEVVGKEGVALIIDCVTDNKQRAVSEVRNTATKAGFNLGSGSVAWQFEQKGRIILKPLKKRKAERFSAKDKIEYNEVNTEELILDIMEIDGVVDVLQKSEGDEKIIEVLTEREKLTRVLNQLEGEGLKIEKAEIAKIAKNRISVSEAMKGKVDDLIKELEASDDVETVWSNIA